MSRYHGGGFDRDTVGQDGAGFKAAVTFRAIAGPPALEQGDKEGTVPRVAET